MSEATWYALLAFILAILAIRGSVKVTRRFRAASRGEGALSTWSERLLVGLLVVICWFLTALAMYLSVLSVYRLVGFPPLTWTPAVSASLAIGVLLIPAAIGEALDLIARGRLRP